MRLRILTVNTYNGRADVSSLAEALAAHDPDVVAVQELTDDVSELLAGWGHAHLLDPNENTTGMGVAVGGVAELRRLEFPHRDPIVAVLRGKDWGLPRDVEVINLHLVNPISRPLSWSRHLRDRERRAVEDVLSTDLDGRARVLVGDLNSSPAWPLYRHIAKLATDAASSTGTARRTWGPRPSSPRLLRIDHAFVQGARATRTDLVTVTGSDHRGLLIDVAFDR